jgi:hypothetical protein
MVKVLVVLSGIFSALAYVPYIRAILKTRNSAEPVQPNRASWFVWTVIDIAMFASLLAAKSYSAVPMFAAFTVGSTLVFILSIKYGVGGFARLDLSCVAVALAGIVFWMISGDPAVSVAANLLAASAGTLPTLVKMVKKPSSEEPYTWFIFAIGGALNCAAIREFTFIAAAAPITVFALQISMAVASARPVIMKLWKTNAVN